MTIPEILSISLAIMATGTISFYWGLNSKANREEIVREVFTLVGLKEVAVAMDKSMKIETMFKDVATFTPSSFGKVPNKLEVISGINQKEHINLADGDSIYDQDGNYVGFLYTVKDKTAYFYVLDSYHVSVSI